MCRTLQCIDLPRVIYKIYTHNLHHTQTVPTIVTWPDHKLSDNHLVISLQTKDRTTPVMLRLCVFPFAEKEQNRYLSGPLWQVQL